jgi:DNA-binding transcriptional LysR family regulator
MSSLGFLSARGVDQALIALSSPVSYNIADAKFISIGYGMELRHLRYFIAVAEEEHITRAAERLGMQQPPLSQQIKAMERELDVQLFRRKARGVELTNAGRALLAEAKALLAHLDRGLETTRRTARGEQGRLHVGIAPSAPFHPLVPRAFRAFRKAFPLVSLTLEEGLSRDVIARFAKDQMDVAFVRWSTPHIDALVTMPLLEEPMIAALPALHPMARSGQDTKIPLKSLASEPFILVGPSDTGIFNDVIAACRVSGFSPRVEFAPRITSSLGLVAAGLGIAIVPASMQNIRMDGVIYRRLKGAQPKAFLGLASRRGDPSAAVRNFLNVVKRAANQHPAD